MTHAGEAVQTEIEVVTLGADNAAGVHQAAMAVLAMHLCRRGARGGAMVGLDGVSFDEGHM